MTLATDSHKFARLGRPRRIWAIGAVHGDADRLAMLHDQIGPSFHPGDRLVYLGNFLGHGSSIRETVDELLGFRRSLLAVPGMLVGDIVYLRGAQEEMWQKLLQLQFAPNPPEVLNWMLSQGIEPTLHAYGGRIEEGRSAAREGAMQLTRWTNRLRDAIRAADGHNALYAALKRAAFTEPDGAGVLFVSAGIDTDRPLAAQGDSFWWAAGGFDAIREPFQGFLRVVRGFDPRGSGVVVGPVSATLDGGCGRGGTLAAAVFASDGAVIDLVEV